MEEVDIIVVGLGIAGISFCEQLRLNNRSFLVFDDSSQISSTVAGGVYNPVILKRFTLAWMGEEHLELSRDYYQNLQTFLNTTIDYPLPVYRKFNSVQEQNDWIVASDQPNLDSLLSPKLLPNKNRSINAEFGFGEVKNTGMIDTVEMILRYRKYLTAEKKLISSRFIYDNLKIEGDVISYQNITTKHIVFAEGFGIKKNPFFKNLPLNGTKGEILIIKAPDLKLDVILKSSVFIIPLGDDHYYIGATYEHNDKSSNTTVAAKVELLTKLRTVINCNFKVVDQKAGIRPTTTDRRPLAGCHSTHKNLCILNGLGTRGVMIAPFISNELYNHLESGKPLHPEIDIARFS